jgi:hypothetical protein
VSDVHMRIAGAAMAARPIACYMILAGVTDR